MSADELAAMTRDPAHGALHWLEVARTAIHLMRTEVNRHPVDGDVVVLGAFLHDVGLVLSGSRAGHEARGADLARQVAIHLGFSAERAALVANAVRWSNEMEGIHDHAIEIQLVRDADTLVEAMDLNRIAWVSIDQYHRAFFNPDLTTEHRLRILASEDPHIVDAPENDALMYLLRNVTKDLNPDHYLTAAAKKEVENPVWMSRNRASLFELVGRYESRRRIEVGEIIAEASREYWQESPWDFSTKMEISEHYKVLTALSFIPSFLRLILDTPLEMMPVIRDFVNRYNETPSEKTGQVQLFDALIDAGLSKIIAAVASVQVEVASEIEGFLNEPRIVQWAKTHGILRFEYRGAKYAISEVEAVFNHLVFIGNHPLLHVHVGQENGIYIPLIKTDKVWRASTAVIIEPARTDTAPFFVFLNHLPLTGASLKRVHYAVQEFLAVHQDDIDYASQGLPSEAKQQFYQGYWHGMALPIFATFTGKEVLKFEVSDNPLRKAGLRYRQITQESYERQFLSTPTSVRDPHKQTPFQELLSA